MSREQRALLRRNYLGFVFQGFNLLKRTTALENLELPLIYRGVQARRAPAAGHGDAGPGRPRRPLATIPRPNSPAASSSASPSRARWWPSPSVVFADEPTGNLDTAKSHEIMQLLQSLNRERGLTIVLVTHEEDVAAYARAAGALPRRADRIRHGRARMIMNALLLALREIRNNLLRAGLTTLGIVIGVAAVILMVTLGAGATKRVTADIGSLGDNMLLAHPGPAARPADRGRAVRDVDRRRRSSATFRASPKWCRSSRCRASR